MAEPYLFSDKDKYLEVIEDFLKEDATFMSVAKKWNVHFTSIRSLIRGVTYAKAHKELSPEVILQIDNKLATIKPRGRKKKKSKSNINVSKKKVSKKTDQKTISDVKEYKRHSVSLTYRLDFLLPTSDNIAIRNFKHRLENGGLAELEKISQEVFAKGMKIQVNIT